MKNRGRKTYSHKKTNAGFTLVELLVVISIIAMLMAILVPSLTKARDQAYTVLCSSRLRQWGIMFDLYAEDNNYSLPASWYGGSQWMVDLLPYYKGTEDVRLCPKAKKFLSDTSSPWQAGVYTAWGKMGEGSWEGYIPSWGEKGMYGSYGMNGWASNPPPGSTGGDPESYFWRKAINVKKADTVPLMGGCMWDGTTPLPTDRPPQKLGVQNSYDMSVYCLPRHSGKVNMLFMDHSIRSVGMRELWSLNWHTEWFELRHRWPSTWPPE